MEPLSVTSDRSDVPAFESLLFNEEIQRLIAPPPPPPPPGNAASFTAILELGPTQAMELLHWPETSGSKPYVRSVDGEAVLFNSPSSALPNSGAKCDSSSPDSSTVSSQKVKKEVAAHSASKSNSWTHPVVSDTAVESKVPSSKKRKEREQKGKGSAKKKKNESPQDAQSLPCVHVRARRGQATDSHSLAERARREKINARMKLLQDLVPGCNKISGTALVLDEIINHVQSLQRQVELLSMKLAAVNPQIDFNLDSIFAPENVSLLDGNFPVPLMWPETQINGSREHYQQHWHFPSFQQPVWGKEEGTSSVAPHISHLTHNCSANAGSSLNNYHQLKMEM